MTERVQVGPVGTIDDPGRVFVEHDGMEIGVIKREGEYHALLNVCAHQGGPVCKGEVRPELVAEDTPAGEHVKEGFDGETTVACPWHGHTYYLESGEHIGDGERKLPTFNVVVEDDVVYVEV